MLTNSAFPKLGRESKDGGKYCWSCSSTLGIPTFVFFFLFHHRIFDGRPSTGTSISGNCPIPLADQPLQLKSRLCYTTFTGQCGAAWPPIRTPLLVWSVTLRCLRHPHPANTYTACDKTGPSSSKAQAKQVPAFVKHLELWNTTCLQHG